MKKDYKCREGEFLSEESVDILCEPAIARPLELQQEIMARLFEAARVAAMQPQELEEYITTMVTERDIKNYISYAQKKGQAEGLIIGKAEGIAEGKAEGILQTAKNLKAKGIPLNIIKECTGLSDDEIEQL